VGIRPFAVQFFANHVGKYKNWGSGTITPLVLNADGNVAGGGDVVKAWTTIDFHASYEIRDGSEVYIDANNLFNTEPPFFNNSAGHDSYGSNPLGRVISVGFRAKF
jgi:iron complex outermembrane recepter protein